MVGPCALFARSRAAQAQGIAGDWIVRARGNRGAIMEHVAEWTAHIYLFEHDTNTQARISLETGTSVLQGEGLARRRSSDPQVPEIGDELAVGRALIELGERLVRAAAEDIAALARKTNPTQ
jgi:hypothetical protein